MWVIWAVIAILVVVLGIFRFRQKVDVASGEAPPSESLPKNMGADMEIAREISTEIGLPPEAVDPNKAGYADRQAGVSLHRIPPVRQQPGDGSLRSVRLRKTDLSKEVELAWEAGGLIEFQPGAWAGPEDISEHPSSPDQGQERPLPTVNPAEETYSLPQRYGVDRLVLMARDPHWVYAYWEITHEKYRQMYEKHLRDWGLSRPVLRIYDLTPGQGRRIAFDVFISDDADNWYINIPRPRHTLMAQLGRLFPDDTFISLIESNVITMPPDTFSDKICPEWPPVGWPARYPDYRGKIGLSSPSMWGNGIHG